MTYAVKFTKSAQKELNTLPKNISIRIAKSAAKLADNPRKDKVRPMVGTKSWCMRVGDYRIIYDILDKELVILIIRVRHRKEAYR